MAPAPAAADLEETGRKVAEGERAFQGLRRPFSHDPPPPAGCALAGISTSNLAPSRTRTTGAAPIRTSTVRSRASRNIQLAAVNNTETPRSAPGTYVRPAIFTRAGTGIGDLIW